MPRAYPYIGPVEIRMRVTREEHCMKIGDRDALILWLEQSTSHGKGRCESIPATYIIDTSGHLWLADRRSEHVACSDGQDVLAAGEIFFENGKHPFVGEVTNLSTGYCPEPACWDAVRSALDELGIEHPSGFTPAFEFRRCEDCGTANVIKDDYFHCAVCDSPLPEAWNF